MNKLQKLTAALFLSAISFGSFAQTVDEIVNKHIEAIGGKENWAKVKTLKTEAKMKAQGAEIQMTILQVDKKAMRQNISLMGMTGYSIITTTEGWNYMPFQGQTKPEPMTADDVKNAQEDLQLQNEFISYKEQGKKLEYLGKDDIDGTECFKLKMTDKDAQETTYFMDAGNYYIVKETRKIKANGQEMDDTSTFGNYKKLPEGIVFPMSITSGWGDMEITKLEVNGVIEDSNFSAHK